MQDLGPGAADASQAEVLSFLETRAFTAVGPVRRVDTHAASIFLSGDRAWKLKRAVRFDYLDFSTAERRRNALTCELRLNREIAPDLYLGLHAITRGRDGALAIDGPGAPVDWLLEMRRFPDGTLLAEQPKERLTLATMNELADRIARFHAQAEVVPGCDGADRLASTVAANELAFAPWFSTLEAADVRDMTARQRQMLEKHRALLDSRAARGRVRLGHGDLHAGNIALIDGIPVMLDRLEFSRTLASVDVLYDMAFLLMDLWQRDLRCEAALVFNRYLDVSPEDADGIPLLPLFMSVRAAIRSHVCAATASRDGEESAKVEARRYLAIARALLEPVPARLIAIGGLSGTGKSSLARAIAGRGRPPGARTVRSDVVRKNLAGVWPDTPLPANAYGFDSRRLVYRLLETRVEHALECGQTVVADAVFAGPEERDAIACVAARAAAPFTGLWLQASAAERVKRVSTRAADASDANVEVARNQQAYAIGDLGPWIVLEASEPMEAVAAAAEAVLDNAADLP